MIFGAFSTGSGRDKFISVSRVLETIDPADIIYTPVNDKFFSGGFCLNIKLPFREQDVYFHDESDDIMVLLSGSVYNRHELSAMSDISAPVPDAELIARLFLAGGKEFAELLNGDFVIFILRPSRAEAYLYRDHAGISPVAYFNDGDTFYFSSDYVGLCRALSHGQTIDPDFMSGRFRFVDRMRTPDSRVKKLLPGHYLYISLNETKLVRYWNPSTIREDGSMSYDIMLSDLGRLVRDAVKIRCDARFNAGAHVSGGIDSGIVSALAVRECNHQERFYGFSWTPDREGRADTGTDEREIIRAFCSKTGITPVFSGLDVRGLTRAVNDFYHNRGYFHESDVIEKAGALGINLIFSGWGGDEFISAGDRAVDQELLRKLRLRLFLSRNSLKHPRRFARDLMYYVLFPALGILDARTARSFRDDARYLKRGFRKSSRREIRNYYFHTSRRQLHLRLLNLYHLQERCEIWALNGFRHGIEYRYPLLDKRIIEYMLKVPSELLCRNKNYRPLLREIGAGILPDEVRLNMSKKDTVLLNSIEKLFSETAGLFMDEVAEWEKNPDMQFIDFRLLRKDISTPGHCEECAGRNTLSRAVIYIKAIHEFTKKYREEHRSAWN